MQNLMLIFLNDPEHFLITNWNNFFWILVIFVLMSTLIFKESLDALKSVSIIAVIAIFIFFISLVIIFIYKLAKGDGSIVYNESFLWPKSDFLVVIGSLPTVFLAFTFQFNLFPIYFTIKDKTNDKLMKSTFIGVGFCLFIYLLTGFLGLFMYSTQLNDSILKALYEDGKAAKENGETFIMVILILVNIAFLTSAVMSIPLMFFSLKKNLINTIIFCRRKVCKRKVTVVTEQLIEGTIKENDPNESTVTVSAVSSNMEKIITVIVYCSICGVSILVPNLQTVMLKF
jgi:amino acid permease